MGAPCFWNIDQQGHLRTAFSRKSPGLAARGGKRSLNAPAACRIAGGKSEHHFNFPPSRQFKITPDATPKCLYSDTLVQL
jgi:hypothetical protein